MIIFFETRLGKILIFEIFSGKWESDIRSSAYFEEDLDLYSAVEILLLVHL